MAQLIFTINYCEPFLKGTKDSVLSDGYRSLTYATVQTCDRWVHDETDHN